MSQDMMMENTIVQWRMALGRSYQELHLLMCFVSYSDTLRLIIPLLEGKKYFSISVWLKIPRLIVHIQLALAKFERRLRYPVKLRQ